MLPLRKVELSFYGVYQPMHVHCNAKKYVFIAAILSELHVPCDAMLCNRSDHP